MISYVITSLGSFFTKERMAELKNFVGSAAESFGKTLSDITHDIKDKFFSAMNWVEDTWNDATKTVKEGAEKTTESVKETFEKMTKKSE